MAAEDEDFDVEAWNRRLEDTPSGPIGPPRVRTRRLDRPRHPSELPPLDHDPLGPDPLDGDLFADPLTGTEAVAGAGFPEFEHNQWTVEGEIERFGAFGRGVAHSQGWKRGVALVLLGLLVLPLLIEAAQLVGRILS